MAQVIIQRAPAAPDVYCYDKPTNAAEVNTTLHEIVSKYRETRSIYVISGTHGCADGTVVPNCKEPDFKYEDLNSANKTSRLIHIRDYHQTAPNRWAELRQHPGQTGVLVLAFCFSSQWFNNKAPGGNDGKL